MHQGPLGPLGRNVAHTWDEQFVVHRAIGSFTLVLLDWLPCHDGFFCLSQFACRQQLIVHLLKPLYENNHKNVDWPSNPVEAANE